MPQGIVLLDLKGFGKLSAHGQDAVFQEFIPRVRKLVRDGQIPRDANTCGDSILAVFEHTGAAAKFALDVRHLVRRADWQAGELSKLGVRIALHVGDVQFGKDELRALAKDDSHAYGSAIVVPARLEPRVPENQIWLTAEAATHVETLIAEGQFGADVRLSGPTTLPKSAGTRTVFWLLEKGEQPPDLAQEVIGDVGREASALSQETLHRVGSLRALNEYVEKFHVWAQGDHSDHTLKLVLKQFAEAMLFALRLPAAGQTVPLVNAGILERKRGGHLQPTYMIDNEYHHSVPSMQIRTHDNKPVCPDAHAGVAPYCLYRHFRGEYGVAIAHDVHTSPHIVYHRRTRKGGEQGVGSYVDEKVDNVYRYKHDRDGRDQLPPYRSLINCAIPRVSEAWSDPEADYHVEWVGTLDITSREPDAFTHQDCAWAEAATSLIGSLYQSHHDARKKALAKRSPPAGSGKNRHLKKRRSSSL